MFDEPPPVVPSNRSGIDELLCFKCDYRLQGLPHEGRCPECGEPIAATLEAVRLGEAGKRKKRVAQLGSAQLVAVLSLPPVLGIGWAGYEYARTRMSIESLGAVTLIAILFMCVVPLLFIAHWNVRPNSAERWRIHNLEIRWRQTRWIVYCVTGLLFVSCSTQCLAGPF